MAEATNTLAGLVQMNDANLADLDVTDLLQDAPLIARLVAVPASQGGTVHKYLKQTVAAGAEFRAVNTGVANAASQDELVTATCKYLDGSFHRDVAIARGYRAGVPAYIAKETMRGLKSMFAGLEAQLLQGTATDADGFSGFSQNTFVDTLDDSMVVDAGGSGGKSCWVLRTTEDDVAIVAGNDGEVAFQWDEDVVQKIITNTSTGAGYNAWNVDLGGWYALQNGSKYSLARIVNLDATSDDLLTDALIAEALSKFPASRPANLIVMDRVLQKELRAGRTATNPSGQPAPFPDEAFGVPIVISDQGSTSESAIVTTTTTTT